MEHKPIVALVTGTSYVPEMLFHEKLSKLVNIVTTRFLMPEVSYKALNDLLEDLPKAVELVQDSEPSLIVVPIMTGSCLKGESIINMLEQQTGVPVLMSAQETVKIFQRLGAKRVALVSPFGVEINLLEKIYFSRAGIEITHFISTNENLDGNPRMFGMVNEEQILQQIRSSNLDDTDAMLFDCPAYDIDPFIEKLSAEYHKPVFSIMQVMMFRALERLGLPTGNLELHRYLGE